MIRQMDEIYNKHEKLVADFKKVEIRFVEEVDDVSTACTRAIILCAAIVAIGVLTHVAVVAYQVYTS